MELHSAIAIAFLAINHAGEKLHDTSKMSLYTGEQLPLNSRLLSPLFHHHQHRLNQVNVRCSAFFIELLLVNNVKQGPGKAQHQEDNKKRTTLVMSSKLGIGGYSLRECSPREVAITLAEK
jgi:hypothetical protein